MSVLDLFSEWAALLQQAQQGQRISKAAVLRLLDSQSEVTQDGRELLAGLIEGRYQYQVGRAVTHTDSDRRAAVALYRAILKSRSQYQSAEQMIRRAERRKVYRYSREDTDHTIALELTAGRFKVDPRTLQRWISSYDK